MGSQYRLKLKDEEQDEIEMAMEKYYLENWHTVILECLKFKDPCIANLESLTSYLANTRHREDD